MPYLSPIGVDEIDRTGGPGEDGTSLGTVSWLIRTFSLSLQEPL